MITPLLKNKILKTVLFLIFIISVVAIYKYPHKDYYESGEIDEIKIKVGETFKIKLSQNPSTGYLNCWINQNKFRLVTLTKTEFPDSAGVTDCIGCSEAIILNFKAIKTGTDTIKFAFCPAGREGKICSDYTNKK